jgi:N-acetyltransferase 10
MMSLYVASHYKNSPNDLQLMSDAPAHRLFVLLAPVDQTTNELPEILCVVQVTHAHTHTHTHALSLSLSLAHTHA